MTRLGTIGMIAGGVAAALVVVTLERGGARRVSPVPRHDGARSAAESDTSLAEPGAARDAESSGRPRGTASPGPESGGEQSAARALEDELDRMSEGYRNRVFLRAIREHGYFCDALVDARVGREDVVIWRAVCDAGRAYFIDVDEAGELTVEPLYYGDPLLGGFPVPENAPRRRDLERE